MKKTSFSQKFIYFQNKEKQRKVQAKEQVIYILAETIYAIYIQHIYINIYVIQKERGSRA